MITSILIKLRICKNILSSSFNQTYFTLKLDNGSSTRWSSLSTLPKIHSHHFGSILTNGVLEVNFYFMRQLRVALSNMDNISPGCSMPMSHICLKWLDGADKKSFFSFVIFSNCIWSSFFYCHVYIDQIEATSISRFLWIIQNMGIKMEKSLEIVLRVVNYEVISYDC